MGFINDLSDRQDMKTADYQRGIILKSPVGPGPAGIHLFELHWHSNLIRFNARQGDSKLISQPTPVAPARFDLDWEIIAVEVPENFPENSSTICQVIKEALAVFGECFSNERINSIEVQYLPDAFKRKILTRLM